MFPACVPLLHGASASPSASGRGLGHTGCLGGGIGDSGPWPCVFGDEGFCSFPILKGQ